MRYDRDEYIYLVYVKGRKTMIQLECYHGTSFESAKCILRDQCFLPSRDNGKLRLGEGAYFFCKGHKAEYAIDCARQLEFFHHENGKHVGEYAILSCIIECEDDELFDMYQPDVMEMFHNARYYLHAHHLQLDRAFRYASAEAADTETMNFLRRSKRISVVKCPQFFGMFARESKMLFSGKKQYPKTFVPNIMLVCADTTKAKIRDIQLIEKEAFSIGSTESI